VFHCGRFFTVVKNPVNGQMAFTPSVTRVAGAHVESPGWSAVMVQTPTPPKEMTFPTREQ